MFGDSPPVGGEPEVPGKVVELRTLDPEFLTPWLAEFIVLFGLCEGIIVVTMLLKGGVGYLGEWLGYSLLIGVPLFLWGTHYEIRLQVPASIALTDQGVLMNPGTPSAVLWRWELMDEPQRRGWNGRRGLYSLTSSADGRLLDSIHLTPSQVRAVASSGKTPTWKLPQNLSDQARG